MKKDMQALIGSTSAFAVRTSCSASAAIQTRAYYAWPEYPLAMMTTVLNPVAMDHKELFLNISVHLTGFDEAELEGTGMVDTYYLTIRHNDELDELSYFFQMVESILMKRDPEILSDAIRTQLMPSSAYKGLAQKIITMWYTGAWTSLSEERMPETEIISSQAYKQGLLWTVIEAHPPGAKQPGYGSWSLPPL